MIGAVTTGNTPTKLRPYFSSIGFATDSAANPITLAEKRFQEMLLEIPNEKCSLAIKQKVQARLDAIFKVLKTRSVYGEGYLDSNFTNIALQLHSLDSKQKQRYLLSGDFTNARGARKLITAALVQNDHHDNFELRDKSHKILDSVLESLAQEARIKLLEFLKKQNISEEDVIFLSSPGDEIMILIEPCQNLDLSPNFPRELEAFVSHLNEDLRQFAENLGFRTNEHFKNKNPTQSGFGLVLGSTQIVDSIEKSLEQIEHQISTTKSKLYSASRLNQNEQLVTRAEVQRKTIPQELATDLLKRLPEAKDPKANLEILEHYQQIRSYFPSYMAPELVSFFSHLDQFISLPDPSTDTLTHYSLDHEYDKALASGESPRLLLLSASGLASFSAISKNLGTAYLQELVKILLEQLNQCDYGERAAGKMIFSYTGGMFWILAPVNSKQEEFLEYSIQEAVKALQNKTIGELADQWSREFDLPISIDAKYKDLKVANMQSPKVFQIGDKEIQRQGLWPIVVGSGKIAGLSLTEVKQQLMTVYRAKNRDNLAVIARRA